MLVLVTFAALASAATCWLTRQGRYERCARLLSALVTVLLIAFAVQLTVNQGDTMATKAARTAKLVKAAEAQMAKKEYDAAIETCVKLQPLDPAEAHRIRGEAYEHKGNIGLARMEYQASYFNGNHTASGSVKRLDKKGGTQ